MLGLNRFIMAESREQAEGDENEAPRNRRQTFAMGAAFAGALFCCRLHVLQQSELQLSDLLHSRHVHHQQSWMVSECRGSTKMALGASAFAAPHLNQESK